MIGRCYQWICKYKTTIENAGFNPGKLYQAPLILVHYQCLSRNNLKPSPLLWLRMNLAGYTCPDNLVFHFEIFEIFSQFVVRRGGDHCQQWMDNPGRHGMLYPFIWNRVTHSSHCALWSRKQAIGVSKMVTLRIVLMPQ